MTLTLSPELEQKIASRAKQLGVSTDAYAEDLLARDVASKGVFLGKGAPLTGDQFVEAMKKVAKPAPAWVTSDDTFSREMIYRDDD